MLTIITRRVLQAIPVLLALSLLAFALSHVGGGNPIADANATQKTMTPAEVAQVEQTYGLNKPLPEQYVTWLGNFVTGRWGDSIALKVPVTTVIIPAYLNTLILTLAALIICVVLGVLIGSTGGLAKGTVFDRLTMGLAQIANNLPVYWLGVMLLWLFAVTLDWLPAEGMHNVLTPGSFPDLLRHLVLPAFSAAAGSLLILARLTRGSVSESLGSDYVRTYRSQGISRRRIFLKHVGRNVLPTVVNISGLQIGYLVGGVIFVEQVFNWPGIGTQLFAAIGSQDFPVIQAGVMLVAVSILAVNLITDVVLDFLNPRIRHA